MDYSIRYSGTDRTNRGMSGGGVFTTSGTLIGLHRGRREDSHTHISVRAKHIFDRLRSKNLNVIAQDSCLFGHSSDETNDLCWRLVGAKLYLSAATRTLNGCDIPQASKWTQ